MAMEFHYHRRRDGDEEEEHFDLKASASDLAELRERHPRLAVSLEDLLDRVGEQKKEKAPPVLVDEVDPHPAMVAEAPESNPDTWVWVITFKRV